MNALRGSWLAVVGLVLMGSLAGCSGAPVEPWVKPYQRQKLADPIMRFARVPVTSAYLQHVHQAREGARGAEGGAAAGCGCN